MIVINLKLSLLQLLKCLHFLPIIKFSKNLKTFIPIFNALEMLLGEQLS